MVSSFGVMLKMKRKVCSFLIAILHLLTWVSAISRPFPPYDGVHQQGQISHCQEAVLESKQGHESVKSVNRIVEAFKGLSTLGSRPPNCEHKCRGCKPCNAIQVPTTTHHLKVQYANYEPEGWKCKCGSYLFNP